MLRDLLRAVGGLAADMAGTLAFAVLMALGAPIPVAVAAGAAIASAMVLLTLRSGRSVPALQWLSLALVLVSGAATLFTHDARFMMIKPSIIAVVVGIAMLKPDWLEPYMMPEQQALIPDVTRFFGFVWAGLMFVTAALNLIVVMRYPDRWVAFIAIFPIVAKMSLFAVHFITATAIAMRRRGMRSSRPILRNAHDAASERTDHDERSDGHHRSGVRAGRGTAW